MLFSIPHPAHAAPKPDIFCKPAGALLKFGTFAEVMYRDGTGYEYTFSKNTLGGPKVMAKFPVSLEATRPGPYGCQIDVTKIADGSHRFYVEQEGKSAKWKLALPGEQKGARLKCTVKESLRLALCEPGYTPEEMQSPAD